VFAAVLAVGASGRSGASFRYRVGYVARVAAVGGTERRRNAIALGMVFLPLIVIGAFAYRPAPLLGIHGDPLAESLSREAGSGSSLLGAGCAERSSETWRCGVPDAGGSAKVRYEVETRGLGCWDARKVEGGQAKGGNAGKLSGCISGLDFASTL
jgi:hypothetical protein